MKIFLFPWFEFLFEIREATSIDSALLIIFFASFKDRVVSFSSGVVGGVSSCLHPDKFNEHIEMNIQKLL